ncbi:hypothetical protein F3Y22_tig00111151pilonHSYRG00189 [Hibiscus syriacus]|uniref:Uncharacterized protein n=1 Tax=Hibiscus syriacus TaxID=106335 RepID=A0A6A2YXM8_HIBSY|nr:hypothetical protein F3Y22_tig00111151pilonHSYRG00189 [Hibiscus syriacus]
MQLLELGKCSWVSQALRNFTIEVVGEVEDSETGKTRQIIGNRSINGIVHKIKCSSCNVDNGILPDVRLPETVSFLIRGIETIEAISSRVKMHQLTQISQSNPWDLTLYGIINSDQSLVKMNWNYIARGTTSILNWNSTSVSQQETVELSSLVESQTSKSLNSRKASRCS